MTIAEQRRIVAKVAQLMALVDALETQLAASRATAANLLSALIEGAQEIRHLPQPSPRTRRRGDSAVKVLGEPTLKNIARAGLPRPQERDD